MSPIACRCGYRLLQVLKLRPVLHTHFSSRWSDSASNEKVHVQCVFLASLSNLSWQEKMKIPDLLQRSGRVYRVWRHVSCNNGDVLKLVQISAE